MSGEIRLRVAASLEENVEVLFRPLVPAAEKHGRLVGQAFAKGFKEGAGPLGGGATGRGGGGGGGGSPGGGPSREEQQKAREMERAKKYVAGLRDKYFVEQQREEEKADKRAVTQREKASQQEIRQKQAEAEKKRRLDESNQKYIQSSKDKHFAEQQRSEERAEKKATADRERRAKQEARRQEGEAQQKARAEERARKYVQGIKDRYLLEDQRREEREEKKKGTSTQRRAERAAREEERESRSFGRRTSYEAAQTFGRITSSGVRYASDLAKGAGVNLDLGAAVGQAVDLRRMASELSNSSYMPGASGAAGRRVSAGELEGQARQTGDFAGFDATETLAGLKEFVGKTGDLQTGRNILKDMAILSKATGTNLSDMVAAAGDAAMALDETPGALKQGEDKATKLGLLMRTIAGQGKLGAVEISSLATQMAKLSSSSSVFGGSDVENMASMGTLVQMARAKGGAVSAESAATSVSSFVGMIQTGKRMDAFKAATGKDIYDQKTKKYRGVEDIVVSALEATGGDPKKLKKIFANVQGERAVKGFATTYLDAGGGKSGIAAVKAEFAKYRNVSMGQGEIQESFNRRMGDYDTQVTLFNNKIGEVGASLASRVLPQLNALAPSVIKTVGSFADLAAWAAKNPFRAIVTALGASILKAGIENVLRSGIETMLKTAFTPRGPSAFMGMGGGLGGGGGGGSSKGGEKSSGVGGTALAGGGALAAGAGAAPGAMGGKFGKAMAAAGAAFAIAATTVTIAEVGMLAIDKIMDMKTAKEDAARSQQIDRENKESVDKAQISEARANAVKKKQLLMSQGRYGEAAQIESELASGVVEVDEATYRSVAERKVMADRRVEGAEQGPLRKEDAFYGMSQVTGLGWLAQGLSGGLSYASGHEYGTSFAAQEQRSMGSENLGELKAEQQRATEHLAQIKAGIEKIAAGGAPIAPGAGTSTITPP